MISVLLDFMTSPTKNLSASLISAVIGQITFESTTNLILQRGAWSVAILAGIMTVINLFFPLRSFYENYKRKSCKKL